MTSDHSLNQLQIKFLHLVELERTLHNMRYLCLLFFVGGEDRKSTLKAMRTKKPSNHHKNLIEFRQRSRLECRRHNATVSTLLQHFQCLKVHSTSFKQYHYILASFLIQNNENKHRKSRFKFNLANNAIIFFSKFFSVYIYIQGKLSMFFTDKESVTELF